MKAPVERSRQLVVVLREALAQKSQKVLVNEVEPEEPVAVHAPGIANPGEDMPGRCNRKEEEKAAQWFEIANALVVAGESQVDASGSKEEDKSNKPLRQDR
jgi:hypothetical protein